MKTILKTTIATVFTAACLAGASMTFAADNGGNNGGMNNGGMNSGVNSKPGSKDSDALQTDPNSTGSIKCDNSNANVNSGCNKPGMLQQEQNQRSKQRQ